MRDILVWLWGAGTAWLGCYLTWKVPDKANGKTGTMAIAYIMSWVVAIISAWAWAFHHVYIGVTP